MDSAIGFSRSPKEATAANADAETAAADTVCKYCGEDFKFYRSLKHHLRSQSSCYHKPFSCRDCAVGFSTKANCLRHIQKQHRAVTGVSTESRMVVDETLLAAQQKAAATCIGTRKRGSEAVDDQRNKVQRQDMVVVTNGNIKMKQEQMEMSSDDQPLDFSLKTMMTNSLPGTPYNGFSLPDADTDEPMDLSIGATRSAAVPESSEFDSCAPISLVISSRRSSPAAEPSAGMMQCQPSATSPSLLQCTQCRAVFKHSAKVQRRSYVYYFIFIYFYLLHCISFSCLPLRLPNSDCN